MSHKVHVPGKDGAPARLVTEKETMSLTEKIVREAAPLTAPDEILPALNAAGMLQFPKEKEWIKWLWENLLQEYPEVTHKFF